MKNEMKLNNKGFSLVELIVVIAIMAILVGVLAPSVLGQLDKAKVAKDKQTLDSIATAVAIAWADPDIQNPTVSGTGDVSLNTAVGITSGASFVQTTTSGTDFSAVCQATVGYTQVMFESNAFSSCTSLDITVNTVTGKVTVTATGTTGNNGSAYFVTK